MRSIEGVGVALPVFILLLATFGYKLLLCTSYIKLS